MDYNKESKFIRKLKFMSNKNKPSEAMKYGFWGYVLVTGINSGIMCWFFNSLEKTLKASSKLMVDFNFQKFMSEYYIHQSDYLNFWLFSLTIVLAIIGIFSAIEFRSKIEEMDKKKEEMDKIIQRSKTEIAVNKSKMDKMNKSIEDAKIKMAEDLKEVKDYVKNAKESEEKAQSYTWFNKGIQSSRDKNNEEAIEYYTKAIEFNSDFADAYVNRGVAYRENKEFEKAIKDYTKAIEINPKYAEAYCNRGVAYGELGNLEKEIENYTKAIEINPKYADVYYNRGIAYCEKKEMEKSIKDCTKAIEINPKHAKAYCNRGAAYFKSGELPKAIEDYKKSLEIDADRALVYYNLTESYIFIDDLEEALKTLNIYIEKEPNPVISNDDHNKWMGKLDTAQDQNLAKQIKDIVNQLKRTDRG